MDAAVKRAHPLPAELSIYTVGELHPQWLAWLGEDRDDDTLWLDGSAVAQADAAGVQLLLSLSASLKLRGLALGLQEPSTPLLAACTALGLGDWAAQCSQTCEETET